MRGGDPIPEVWDITHPMKPRLKKLVPIADPVRRRKIIWKARRLWLTAMLVSLSAFAVLTFSLFYISNTFFASEMESFPSCPCDPSSGAICSNLGTCIALESDESLRNETEFCCKCSVERTGHACESIGNGFIVFVVVSVLWLLAQGRMALLFCGVGVSAKF